MDQFPPQPPQSPPPYGMPAPPPGPDARESVKLPAIFLIIVGVLGFLVALLAVAGPVISGAAGQPNPQLDQIMADPNLPPAFKRFVESGSDGSLSIVLGVIWIIVSGLVVFGAIQMMRLRTYGLAVAASILVMVPCILHPCCFCVGLPIGIWALVVLNKPEVKAAFANASSPTVIR